MRSNRIKRLSRWAIVVGALVASGQIDSVRAKAKSPTSVAVQSRLEDVRRYLTNEAAQDRLSGSVAILKDGRLLFAGGYGLADREQHLIATPDTRYNLASVNKFITRIAVFQLIEAGKLHAGDKVGDVIPEYPNPEVRAKVTVRQLLDMTAGIPMYWNQRYRERRADLRSTDDFLALFVDEPLRFEPGRFYEYSNGGFVVLGKLIEAVTGMSYERYVRLRITGPAGMTRTGLEPYRPNEGYAVGYTQGGMRDPGDPPSDAPLRPNLGLLPGWGSSAGGGYSTVRDFARLDGALRRGRLLGSGVRADFLGPDFLAHHGAAGWHGGTPGASSIFSMLPDGVTVVVFTNRDPALALEVRDKVLALLGEPIPPPPARSAPTFQDTRR